jgi:hypothetical protein
LNRYVVAFCNRIFGQIDAPICDTVVQRQAVVEVDTLDWAFEHFKVVVTRKIGSTEIVIVNVRLEFDPAPSTLFDIPHERLAVGLVVEAKQRRMFASLKRSLTGIGATAVLVRSAGVIGPMRLAQTLTEQKQSGQRR